MRLILTIDILHEKVVDSKVSISQKSKEYQKELPPNATT